MRQKIDEIFEDSLLRYICKGAAFVSAVVFAFLSLGVLAAALAESVWWLAALPATGSLCGALVGFFEWLDR